MPRDVFLVPSITNSICISRKKNRPFTFTNDSIRPNTHTLELCFKSLKVLGFIQRITRKFHLVASLKSLHCALVGMGRFQKMEWLSLDTTSTASNNIIKYV